MINAPWFDPAILQALQVALVAICAVGSPIAILAARKGRGKKLVLTYAWILFLLTVVLGTTAVMAGVENRQPQVIWFGFLRAALTCYITAMVLFATFRRMFAEADAKRLLNPNIADVAVSRTPKIHEEDRSISDSFERKLHFLLASDQLPRDVAADLLAAHRSCNL